MSLNLALGEKPCKLGKVAAIGGNAARWKGPAPRRYDRETAARRGPSSPQLVNIDHRTRIAHVVRQISPAAASRTPPPASSVVLSGQGLLKSALDLRLVTRAYRLSCSPAGGHRLSRSRRPRPTWGVRSTSSPAFRTARRSPDDTAPASPPHAQRQRAKAQHFRKRRRMKPRHVDHPDRCAFRHVGEDPFCRLVARVRPRKGPIQCNGPAQRNEQSTRRIRQWP